MNYYMRKAQLPFLHLGRTSQGRNKDRARESERKPKKAREKERFEFEGFPNLLFWSTSHLYTRIILILTRSITYCL